MSIVEARDDAEIVPAAFQRPEKVCVGDFIGIDDPLIRQENLVVVDHLVYDGG